ncbi:ABC transporter substrate-binding protein [Actinoplanes sp. NBRC 101535]|uniref:ABC transporter substrate-binding protein n=1 Tax=Actinoplanes sp. NBRC 101535 TaxID=3032196 RepID=UPI0024A4029F|nr:ABC transporter substrate-binding protein [Actinoplanes sp. NBRC 101535]GLY06627.1 myristoyl transferase [Actinoplanes sp. NBRC 101535]
MADQKHNSAKRRGWAAGALTLLTALTAACGSGTTAEKPGLEQVTFALSYLPDPSLSGFTYAQQNGLFEKAGLEVEVVPWGSTPSESLVATGQADIGIATDLRTTLLAQAAGMPLVSTAAIFQHTPYVLTTRKSDGYTSPAQLAGKTYGGFGSPMEIAVVNDMIAAAGGKGDAQNVTLSVAAFEALASERVDTVLSFPGNLFDLEKKGTPVDTFDSTKFGVPDGYASNVITSKTYLSEHRDTVQRFMGALRDGYDAAIADPAAANKSVLDFFPDKLDPAQVEYVSKIQTERLFPSPDGTFGTQDPAVWQANADWLATNGILSGPGGTKLDNFDTTGLFTNEFLAQK